MRDATTTERATEGITVRWRPSEKEAVQRAAKATGLPLATIVVNGALKEAARLEREASKQAGGG